MRKKLAIFGLGMVLSAGAFGADFPEWRGVNRDNKSTDTGLLKSWPAEGPKLLWSINNLGKGYSTVAVVGENLYTTGNAGGAATVYCLDSGGKIGWKTEYGKEVQGQFPSSRGTPTVCDGMIYAISGMADVACLDAKTGEKKWGYNMVQKFGGKDVQWHFAESPLVFGENVILTPGGESGVVAVNRKTGELVWKSSLGENSAYCSPAVFQVQGRKLLTTVTASSLVGLDATNGKVLWKAPYRNRYGVHPNTPAFKDGIVFNSSGYDYGAVGLKLSADGSTFTEAYKVPDVSVHHGGLVLVGNHVYAAADKGAACVEIATGKVAWRAANVGKGSLTSADGMLYCYSEKGQVSLVKASPDKCEVAGTFAIKQGSGEHWAHPVVANGKLYIRHGEALMVYNVKQ